MTPAFMYYSVAWVWLEYLTRGLGAAEDAMSKCLDLIQPQKSSTISGEGAGSVPDGRGGFGKGGTSAGERSCCKSTMGFSVCCVSEHFTDRTFPPRRPLLYYFCEQVKVEQI